MINVINLKRRITNDQSPLIIVISNIFHLKTFNWLLNSKSILKFTNKLFVKFFI